MPRITRYFPVSHDINSDHEVWEMTDLLGDRSLRVWLEFVSMSDRNAGMLPPWSDALAIAIGHKCHTIPIKVRQVWDHAHTKTWLVSDPTPRMRNYTKYHYSRNLLKSHAGIEQRPTSETNSTKQNNTIKSVAIAPPDWIPKDAWEDFLEHRKNKRAKVTPSIAKRIFATLETFRGRGHDPAMILNNSIVNGWTGIFEPKQNGKVDPPRRVVPHTVNQLDETVSPEMAAANRGKLRAIIDAV